MDTRYVGYGGGVRGCVTSHCSYHGSMVDRLMMLKFRPIAPKPVSSGSGSSDSTTDNICRIGRGKRRYVRVKRNKCSKKTKARPSSTSSEKVADGRDTVVTLSLMPETPQLKEYWPIKGISPPVWLYSKNNNSYQESRDGHMMLRDNNSSSNNNNNNNKTSRDSHMMLRDNNNNNQTSCDGHVILMDGPQIVSFVMVDRVMETTVLDSGVVEWTEMDKDTCPRFISDGGDRVVWKNKAYKAMAAGGDEAVVVVRREGVWPAAFTCNVRVTCRIGMGGLTTVTVPCDAWRIEGGGYAWRLDVKAALCLGR